MQRFVSFRQAYTCLETDTKIIEDPTFLEVWNTLQARFQPIQQRVIKREAMMSSLSSLSLNPGVSTPAPAKKRLKEIPLPTLLGDLADWRSFWQMFLDAMEDSFSDSEKLCYLRACLKDSTASAIVWEAISHGDSFMDVEERLKAKRDSPKEVFRRVLNELVSLGAIDYTRQGINRLVTDGLRHIHTLEKYSTGSAAQVYTTIHTSPGAENQETQRRVGQCTGQWRHRTRCGKILSSFLNNHGRDTAATVGIFSEASQTSSQSQAQMGT